MSRPYSMRTFAALITLTAAACTTQAPEIVPVVEPATLSEWGAHLAADARAMHQQIADNHPGSVDPLNPGFAAINDAALARALEHAPEAQTMAGWWWGLREYAAAFNDAHLEIFLKDQSLSFQQEWAGFLTAWRAGEFVVGVRDETAAETPPVGARLVSCDGVEAQAFAADRVGRFRGRWDMDAQKLTQAPWLFRDTGNPWVAKPQECLFEAGGQTQAYRINWHPLTLDELGQKLDAVRPPMRIDIYLKALGDGGYWIALPDFTGDPDATLYPKLSALMDEIAAKQADLRAAPYVVLDLRDNGGGSSRWSQIVADALWGEGWIAAHPVPASTSVDWRASPANLAALEPYVEQFRQAGDPVMINWIEQVVGGLRRAMEAGEPYWVDVSGEETEASVEAGAPPVSLTDGKVFVLTDAACFSACLDAVDLWKSAGAIQIGQVTGADTVYIENREADLASGFAGLSLSMKVYRGRSRGNNEPQVPEIFYPGDLGDDGAVEAWVSKLGSGD
ncbi:MAG: peptidase S41 [Acidobacteria bacterium]|nr:peptidase S41 [Acidobacteriota bacterium]